MLRQFLARQHRKNHQKEALHRIRGFTPVRSVLVLCTANRVRSPFAEAWLRRAVPGLVVTSRGVMEGGAPAPYESQDVARTMGLDLSRHRSKRLEPAELVTAPLVLLMEQEMADALSGRFPAMAERIFLLGDFDPMLKDGRDIEDPYLMDIHAYRENYTRIGRALDAVVPFLTLGRSGQATRHV